MRSERGFLGERDLLGERPTRALLASICVAVCGAAAISSATWLLAILLKEKYLHLDDLVEGASLTLLVVTGSLVGSLASLLLWQVGGRRPRWLVLGGGLFVAACSEAVFGLHQIEAADSALASGTPADSFVGLQAPVNFVGDLPTMGLLGSAGGLLWLALLLTNRRFTDRKLKPLALLAGLIVGSLAAWATSGALGTWIPPRQAGVLMSMSCITGASWLVAHLYRRWRLPETCFALSVVTLGEAGVSQAILSSPTVVATLLPAAFRLQAVAWCIVGVVVELNRRVRANRAALRLERERAKEYEALLVNRELSLESTRHEVRSALLLLNSAVDLLGSTSHLRCGPLDSEALGFLRQAGSRVAAAVGERPQTGEIFDVGLALDVEISAARHRGMSVRLVRLPECPSRIAGDPTVLSRVVAELLDNAARHAPGADVVVSMGCRLSSMQITVADNGPGIAATDASAPFEPGWCSSLDAQPRGGMGLPTARWLLESVGGSLEWDSDQPGTVMTVTVPLERSARASTAGDLDATTVEGDVRSATAGANAQ